MASQTTVAMTDLAQFPPTVTDHESVRGGMVLETIDSDPDRNIELFDDGRPPVFSGELVEKGAASETFK